MEMQSKWTVLPPEIWGSITNYLGAEHIGRFKLTGDATLWSQLTAPRAVKRLVFEFVSKGQDSWPGFVNELHSAEDIEIGGTNFPLWRNAAICIPMMPKTLRRLEILFSYSFFNKETELAYPIKEYLPCLEELTIMMDITGTSTWQSQLPETLTHLSLNEWCFDHCLSPTLTFLKVRHMRTSSVQSPVFPPQLVVFESLDPLMLSAFLHTLPTSLSKLSTSPYQLTGFLVHKVAKFPRGLTSLELALNSSTASLSPSASLIAGLLP